MTVVCAANVCDTFSQFIQIAEDEKDEDDYGYEYTSGYQKLAKEDDGDMMMMA